jgi:hypothetical protein
LLFLLNVEPTPDIKRPRQILGSEQYFAVEGFLSQIHCKELTFEAQEPHLELTSNKVKKVEDNLGEVSLSFESEFKTQIPQGAKLTVSGWRLYGEETSMKIFDVQKNKN